jgi:hypothetical protein
LIEESRVLVWRLQGVEKLCTLAGRDQEGGEAFVDCDKIDDLPDVLFHIQGKPFRIPGKAYILQVRSLAV